MFIVATYQLEAFGLLLKIGKIDNTCWADHDINFSIKLYLNSAATGHFRKQLGKKLKKKLKKTSKSLKKTTNLKNVLR